MYIYIINFWAEFPTSEYGGRVSVLAKNDEEAVAFLVEQSKDYGIGYGAEQYIEEIPEAVANAKVKLPVDASDCRISQLKCPSILDTFTT